VSDSTKNDLQGLRFKKLFVVAPGFVTPLSTVKEKEANPTVILLGD
jgi:hypothetical protein